jgi:hypothetical protein
MYKYTFFFIVFLYKSIFRYSRPARYSVSRVRSSLDVNCWKSFITGDHEQEQLCTQLPTTEK